MMLVYSKYDVSPLTSDLTLTFHICLFFTLTLKCVLREKVSELPS